MKLTIVFIALLLLLALPLYFQRERPPVSYDFSNQVSCIDPNSADMFWVVPKGTDIGGVETDSNGFWIAKDALRLLVRDQLPPEIYSHVVLYLWY